MKTSIRPIEAADAPILFPMVFRSPVTGSLVWDGPDSLEEYKRTIADFAARTSGGSMHIFAIVDTDTRHLIGSIGLRPYADGFRGDIGLWLGAEYQGRGHGTRAIHLAAWYGFETLHLEKIEASVFTGNHASRRAFEKNGFRLEGTIRCTARKQGILVDEWRMGLLRTEFEPRAKIAVVPY